MADEFDTWETSSGLVDEYNGKVADAQFAFKSEYQNGERLLLLLDIQSDDPEVGEGGKVTEQYPVGAGWETGDKGKTTVHESGRPKKFNNGSGIGLLIGSIVDAIGLDAAKKLGPTTSAATFVGLDGTWTRKEFTFKTDAGEDQKYHRMLFGVRDGEAKVDTAKSEPATDKAATDKADADVEAKAGPVISAALKVKLKRLAAECDDHDMFVERALTEVDGVDGNAAAEDAIGDAAFYNQLKG